MSPRSAKQFDDIRKQKRELIMETALELFAENGFHATSISQIAKKAGISKGLIYNYYASKEDLLKYLVADLMEEGKTMMSGSSAQSPEESLENMIRSYFEVLRNQLERMKLITSLSLQIGKFEFIRHFAKQKMQAYITLMSRMLKARGFKNPNQEAQLLGVLFDGIVVQYIVLEQEYPLQEIEEYMIEKYCKS